MKIKPHFEEITGKPERCAQGCRGIVKYEAWWGDTIRVLVCERHKRAVEGKEWSEVAKLFGSR